jgi:hypothetical protein
MVQQCSAPTDDRREKSQRLHFTITSSKGAESLDGVGLDWVKLESGPGKVDNLYFGTWRALEVQNGNLDNIFGPLNRDHEFLNDGTAEKGQGQIEIKPAKLHARSHYRLGGDP